LAVTKFKKICLLTGGLLIGFALGSCSSQSSRVAPGTTDADYVSEDVANPFDDLKEDAHTLERSSVTDGRPFYNPVDGEKLTRIAYALYGVHDVTRLQTENPEIADGSSVGVGQKIFFTFDTIKPQSNYLTKDLIDRYAVELGQVLREQLQPLQVTKIERGETLQIVSKRLYGTTRYWTELYLLNQNALGSYDKVNDGVQIEYAPRALVASGKDTNLSAATTTIAKAEVEQTPNAPSPIPAPTPNPEPIGEPTPSQVQEPAPVAAASSEAIAKEVVASPKTPEPNKVINVVEEAKKPVKSLSMEAIAYRAIYGLLIILILVGVYFFTRSKSKPAENTVSASVAKSAKPAGAPRVGVPIPEASAKAQKSENNRVS
jgi:hypothetical protein